MKLYHYSASSCSWRVRIALALKEIAYESIAVDIRKDTLEQDGPDYRAVNPQGQVPTLEWTDIDGAPKRIGQSLAIIEFLDVMQVQPRLIPDHPYLAARARQLAEIVNAGIQPLQNNRVMEQVEQLGGSSREWAKHFIHKGLSAFNATAVETARLFCVGDAPSIADICLIPQLRNAWNFDIPRSEFPLLQRIEERCLSLAAFHGTAPE